MVHVPVLLEETVSRLVTAPGGWFVDGTVGAGGHSVALLAAAGLDARFGFTIIIGLLTNML